MRKSEKLICNLGLMERCLCRGSILNNVEERKSWEMQGKWGVGWVVVPKAIQLVTRCNQLVLCSSISFVKRLLLAPYQTSSVNAKEKFHGSLHRGAMSAMD